MNANPFIHPRRGGFTLIEMLVVISIIVLSLALAIPLFNVMSGDRSIDGAENIVSAMLQRARARAIGLQDRRGVFFFEDPKTKNVMMVVVRIYDSPTGLPAGLYIDVDPQLPEAQSLPTGVGAAFIVGKTSASANTSYAKVGLVSFDALGRFEPLAYNWEPTRNLGGSGPSVWQNQYFFDNTYRITTTMTPAELSRSHVGLMLYDKKSFADVDSTGSTLILMGATQSQWLDGASGMGKSGGLPLMVNRYNGTLIRGE